MCNLSEITDALGILDDNGCPEVTILHCNTQYPTPYEDANLTAMLELFDQFGLPVGLSDHTPGWECDVAATVLGAQVIEKHFTLDKSWPGPDQKASLDPTEFKAMVQAVRHVEAALGDRRKLADQAPRRWYFPHAVVHRPWPDRQARLCRRRKDRAVILREAPAFLQKGLGEKL